MVIGGLSLGKIINSFISWLTGMIGKVVDLLPDSPFNFDIPDYVRDIVGYINYFFPINAFVKILAAWTACILVWYVASLLMRWIKAIE